MRIEATLVTLAIAPGLALAAPPPGAAENPFLPAKLLGQIEAARAQTRGQELAKRIAAVTRPLLGQRYELSPLGEGQPPDSDPRLRLDAFDCTTFIETALALALVRQLEQAESLLDRIRYREGRPHFEERRHLVVGQWIPGLTGLGLLEEITAEVGASETRTIVLELDRERWRRRTVARRLDLPEDAIPEGRFTVPYLPLASLDELLRHTPAGTVLNVVRTPLPISPIVVTHQALLLHDEHGRAVIRHASEGPGRVVDQSPELFLARLRKPKKWPVLGLNLQRLRRGGS